MLIWWRSSCRMQGNQVMQRPPPIVRTIEVASRAGLSSTAFREALQSLAPDVIVAACFPWRLPEWLLELPVHGCLNLHPSLLPDGRGPEPVFWAFRWNLPETGVTVHRMDAGFDTGPLVAQLRCGIPPDATIESLERTLAEQGADLVLECLSDLETGGANSVPQAGSPARYAPNPGPEDLLVPTSWSANHAARFIRAVVPAYGPVPILMPGTGQRLLVRDALPASGTLPADASFAIRGQFVDVRFSDGVLRCRLAAEPQTIRLIGRDRS